MTTNGVPTTFGYDGLGRRVRKTTNGVTTMFLYDGANLAMQLDGAGQPQLEFSYYPGIDHPHAVRQASTGATFYYATTTPGSVVALMDQNNQAVNQYQYTPLGQALAATEQVPQPFRFAGRELDAETGLYYNRARYYDPSLGRFISEDPIGLAGGVNQYAYAGNDPVNYADPFGLDRCTQEQLVHGWTQIDQEGGPECKDGKNYKAVVTSTPRTEYVSALLFRLIFSGKIFEGTLFNGRHATIGELPPIVPGAKSVELASTVHGAMRMADASRLAPEAVATVMANATRVGVQRDGARVFIQEIAGKFNVVVYGERGVVTNLSTISEKALARLGKRYGYTF